MGVKCSLLGHDYGDSEVERERDEDGNELIRTAKRVERCRNCGHTRTISANTEVTALESAAGVVREPDGTVVATNGSAMTEEGVAIETTEGDERTVEEPTPADPPADERESPASHSPETAEPAEVSETGRDESEPVEPTEPVPIDRIEHGSDPQRPAREPGEWPGEPDTAADGLDSSGSLVDGGAAVGRWPDGTTAGTTHESEEGEAATRGKRQSRKPGDALSCGACTFTSPIADSPLRAGDICPDCGTGYLAWETRKG
ncbi:DUF7093 family protein [Halococcus sediminicola]|uniref:DUF7093 family protein n=1 Tax=Halococcus sediminicola TaxID=1264579 RepID=UPI000679CE9D|nr:hypothetical protein [Halococcus sediminicola]